MGGVTAVGVQPHGLRVWPQPGRFSLATPATCADPKSNEGGRPASAPLSAICEDREPLGTPSNQALERRALAPRGRPPTPGAGGGRPPPGGGGGGGGAPGGPALAAPPAARLAAHPGGPPGRRSVNRRSRPAA